MKKNKFKIGDTIILKRRWFLWFNNYVLCEIVGGRYIEDLYESNNNPRWRYSLRIGNDFRRFCKWEEELTSSL